MQSSRIGDQKSHLNKAAILKSQQSVRQNTLKGRPLSSILNKNNRVSKYKSFMNNPTSRAPINSDISNGPTEATSTRNINSIHVNKHNLNANLHKRNKSQSS